MLVVVGLIVKMKLSCKICIGITSVAVISAIVVAIILTTLREKECLEENVSGKLSKYRNVLHFQTLHGTQPQVKRECNVSSAGLGHSIRACPNSRSGASE